MLSKQVEEEMNGVTSPIDPIIAPTNVTLPNELKCKKRGNKKETVQKMCDKKKEKKVQRFVTRKKKNVQRYLTTQNISD
jgi:hypothetical protein